MFLSNFEINYQKRQKVILWLAKFGFSSRDLLAKMLGVNVNGQGDFFKKLADEGITKETYIPGTRKKVVTLSTEGVEEAKIHNPTLAIRTFRRFPLHTIIHSYSIQSFLITQKGVKDFFSETELAKEGYVRRPDLLIINNQDVRIAVEVELTQKDVNRIYYNLHGHADDWQKGKIDYVIYLFTSESVLGHYQELYEKNPWPKFTSPDGNVRHISRTGSFDPIHVHSHGLIKFHKFEPYAL
ncbi:hypothetical protein AAGR08_23670 (plasmid) [Pantoea sp. BRR-3P]|uniref:hypothetical protein n=1 Tax=Pantoea sp. BRR-3P TaxID=3141541 RepID=UPI0031F528F6